MKNSKEITRRDYLERLPEDIKTEAYKAISNDPFNRQFGASLDEVLDEKVGVTDALHGAFVWAVNNKLAAVRYWDEINDKYFSHE